MSRARPLLAVLVVTITSIAAPAVAGAAAPHASTAQALRACAARRRAAQRRACEAQVRHRDGRHGATPSPKATAPKRPVAKTPAKTPTTPPPSSRTPSNGTPSASAPSGATPAGSTPPAAGATPSPGSPSTPSQAPSPTPPPVASTAPCANADLVPNAGDIETVEDATLCLVNQVRGQNGLPALTLDGDLQAAANAHDADMIAEDYFEHDGPAGDTPLSRIEASGYIDPSYGYTVGENLAWGTLDDSTPAAIVQAWVNSPEHLANILQPAYTDTGMAVAPQVPADLSDGDAGATYTEDFGGIDTGS